MKKKIFIVLLIVLTMFTFNKHLFGLTGDVTGDGKIDNADKEYIRKYLLETLNDSGIKKVEENGDVNHDGRITSQDVTDIQSIIETDSSITGRSDATSCVGFKTPDSCRGGKSENGNFGCAWNKKYKFCSPTGLAYLSCGSGKTDAHDIPEMLPRLISYFILLLKTATPIILIIMGMVQIIKAIASSNEDEIKKAKGSLIKKIIAAVLVFFSISIVQFVVDQVVDDDESGSVAACMDCFINNNCGGVTYYTDGYGKCYNVKTKAEVKCNTDIGSKKTN